MTPDRAPRVTLLALLAVCSCAAGERNAAVRVERHDSAGVEIVLNVGPDVPLDRSFSAQLSIGGDEAGPASFYRVLPQGVGTDARGDIHVLDAAMFRVIVFDSAGRFLHSFGRQGGGPGAFDAPDAMVVRADGRVAVRDFRKRGLEWFDSTGASLGFEPLAVRYAGGRILVHDEGLVVPVRVTDATQGVAHYSLLHLGGGDSLTLATQDRPLGRSIMFSGCQLSITMEPLFTPWLTWDAREHQAVVIRGTDYVIDVYRGTERTRSLRRDVAPRPVTEAMALEEVGEGEHITWSGGQCTVPPDVVISERGFADVLPAVARVALTPSGEVWAQRGSVRGEPVRIDVLSAEGAYVGTLPTGSPWPVAFLPDGRLIAIETDSLDVQRLAIYRALDRTDVPE